MLTSWRNLALLSATLFLVGCAHVEYYLQAMHGQFSLLSQARPIDDWLTDENTNDNLKTQLVKIKNLRNFAAQELSLVGNGSYQSYADLKRPFALWNVVATPKLSLKPKLWCFPIAGCVSYRGYYSQEDAQHYATSLRQENYDVQVAGVPAYSTLGWFNDPVLSTFIDYPDAELARLVFHELAHQVLYVKNDSQFNESFAVAVEEEGMERWLKLQGDEKIRLTYRVSQARKNAFIDLLTKYKLRLESLYASALSDDEKLNNKRIIFQALQDEYQALKKSWGGYGGYDRWFAEPLTNAHLCAIATYHDFVPGFRALIAQSKDLTQFFETASALSKLDKTERDIQLKKLAQSNKK